MHLKLSCCFLLSIAISLAYSKSLAAKNKKTKSELKEPQHPKKRISTQQKLGSGHSKGPMANNVQSSVPLPVVMPFPMIPFDNRYPILFPPNGKSKKGRGKKKDPKDETEDETDKDVDDENEGGNQNYKAQGKVANKPKLNMTPKPNKSVLEEANEDDDADEESDNEDAIDEESNNEEAEEEDSSKEENDEQKSLKWKNDDDERANIGEEAEEEEEGREQESGEEEDEEEEVKTEKKKPKTKSRLRRSSFEPIVGNPEDIMPYLMLDSDEENIADGKNSHVLNTRSVEDQSERMFNTRYASEADQSDMVDESEVPRVINTRSVDEDEEEIPHEIDTRDVDEEEEDAPRDIRTRSVPDGHRNTGYVEVPDIQAAQKKYKDAEVAAEALTQIQKALGANPESAVEESHSLADYLRKETNQYDEEIAKDIIETQKAQTRSKIVNDDGVKRDTDFVTAKRKLDNDRAKEHELQQELKELKDIELMTTELELAKYLAIENARHGLQLAQAVDRANVNQAPPAVQNTEYAPMMMQPEVSNYAPNFQLNQPPVQAPWQSVYPPSITYAYNPVHETQNFEGGSRGRGQLDSSNAFSQHQGNTYFVHDYEPPFAPAYQHQPAPSQPESTNKNYQPRPLSTQHTEAKSRQIKKPNAVKPKPFLQRVSNKRPAQEAASIAGRRPAITFPGPTYSPPPFASRNARPRIRLNKNRNQFYKTGYPWSAYKARKPNPALLSFFADQKQNRKVNNYYQPGPLLLQQHYPVYSSSYRAPGFDEQSHHYVEKEQESYRQQPSFIATQDRPQAPSSTSHPVQEEKKPSQKAAPVQAARIQHKPTASYKPSQVSVPQNPQFVHPPQIPVSAFNMVPPPMAPQFRAPQYEGPHYEAPHYTAPQYEASAKEAIPQAFSPYYQTPWPVGSPLPRPFYPQNSNPFETMNTDSITFRGDKQPNVQQQQPLNHLANPNEIPLGYGLYPLPEGADEKMEEDENEVKEVYEQIKDDKEKLQDTRQAADAVTKIENKVGFDPGSIAKLVDFVKQAAVKDVDLSQKAVKRDKLTIKRMEIEHAGEKKSQTDGSNVAANEAQEKLKVDQELLKESQDRLNKIKRMEMIVTGIEAAKYSAMNRKEMSLNKDVSKMNQLRAAKKTNIRSK